MKNCKICKSKIPHSPNTNGAWISSDGWNYVGNNTPICPECRSYYTEKEIDEKLKNARPVQTT